jgi:hypothetical protein
MNINDLQDTLRQLRKNYTKLNKRQRMQIAQMLLKTASGFAMQLRSEVREDDAATNRRTAKRRETEVDLKPPIKPVRVAEPSKPKKPKYSGNHGPSARKG